jgi:hypothetical protein
MWTQDAEMTCFTPAGRISAIPFGIARTAGPNRTDIETDMIYLLPAIRSTPGGSSTVRIYKQTIHRTTQQLWLEGFLGFEPRVVKLKLR